MCPTIQKGRNLVNKRGNYFERRGKLETSVLRKQLIIVQDHQVFFLSALKGQTDGLFVICMPQAFAFVPLQQVPICLIVPTTPSITSTGNAKEMNYKILLNGLCEELARN